MLIFERPLAVPYFMCTVLFGYAVGNEELIVIRASKDPNGCRSMLGSMSSHVEGLLSRGSLRT